MREPPLIAGLEYVSEYLDQDAHDRLMAAVDTSPWQRSADHRVQVYGHHYDHKARAAFRIGELPPWSEGLALRLHRDGFVASVPNMLVANDYRAGAGIFDHRDQDVFGDVVVSISLGSTCVMRFTRSDAGEWREILLEPRSALVLTGEARWSWNHGIPARAFDAWQGREYPRSRRVSLTFRAVPE